MVQQGMHGTIWELRAFSWKADAILHESWFYLRSWWNMESVMLINILGSNRRESNNSNKRKYSNNEGKIWPDAVKVCLRKGYLKVVQRLTCKAHYAVTASKQKGEIALVLLLIRAAISSWVFRVLLAWPTSDLRAYLGLVIVIGVRLVNYTT